MIRHSLFIVPWLSLWPIAAMAESPDIKVAANALFDEGKRLLAHGDLEPACPKFEASLKLLDQLGVRLNLADCYERQGKTASAWAEFREAASRAAKRGDARASYARRRTRALAPKLVRLTVGIGNGQPTSLTIRRDGAVLPVEALGTPLPVNPSSYTIEASAPGHQTWSTRVDATRAGQLVKVEVPQLVSLSGHHEPEPEDQEDAAQGEVDEDNDALVAAWAKRKRRRIALGVSAGGVVALGVGVGLGLAARSTWRSAGGHCNDSALCDPEGAQINGDARLLGNIATVVGGVGMAALVTGAVLYLTAPSVRPVLEHAYLEAHDDSATFGLSGQF